METNLPPQASIDTIPDIEELLSGFEDIYVEEGADPTGEEDTCTGGACKL